MTQDWFYEILRAPDSGEPLRCDGQVLLAGDSRYNVCDGIPVFLAESPQPQSFDYAKHYTTDAEEFDYYDEGDDAVTTTHLRMLRTSVMRQISKDTGLLLDVGCGRAFVAQNLCPQGVKVISLDIALANTKKALSNFPFDNHAAVVADAYHLPFADGTFDCIIASEIIEHTVDPAAFVASLASKLKAGGRLIISTPYRERIAYSLCIHCNCKTPHNAHLHSFDEAAMRRIAASSGCRISQMRLVGNKLLLRTHLVRPLAAMGYAIWKAADGFMNRLLHKSEHFIIVMEKA